MCLQGKTMVIMILVQQLHCSLLPNCMVPIVRLSQLLPMNVSNNYNERLKCTASSWSASSQPLLLLQMTSSDAIQQCKAASSAMVQHHMMHQQCNAAMPSSSHVMAPGTRPNPSGEKPTWSNSVARPKRGHRWATTMGGVHDESSLNGDIFWPMGFVVFPIGFIDYDRC